MLLLFLFSQSVMTVVEIVKKKRSIICNAVRGKKEKTIEGIVKFSIRFNSYNKRSSGLLDKKKISIPSYQSVGSLKLVQFSILNFVSLSAYRSIQRSG